MESLETAACFIDELLDFSSDIGDEEEEEDNNKKVPPFSSSSSLPLDSKPSNQQQQLQKPELNIFDPEDVHHPFPEFLEEELEWLSNENAFPAVESFDIFLDNPITGPKRQSPVSVLEKCSSNSGSSSTILSCYGSLHVPVRARSKRRRRRRNNFSNLSGQQWLWWCCEAKKNKNNVAAATTTTTAMSIASMGRKCTHCLADKTPQWRAGPLGPKTLCNACGVRYKSGRLVPEYRPASSPTFSSEVHSNSHRKILEMRKHKPNT